MKVPFTLDQFMEVFRNYNLAVWPMQLVFYAMALAVIFLMYKDYTWGSKIVSGILAFFWLWMGVVYHFMYFAEINPVARIFGLVFIMQAVLIMYYGVYKQQLSFHFHPNLLSITGLVFVIYALAIYPLFGYLQGRTYPATPTFGLPCPTTIFTFGLLLCTDKKNSFATYLIPLLWAAVGSSAAFKFGIKEDMGLIAASVIFLALSIFSKQLIDKTAIHIGKMSPR